MKKISALLALGLSLISLTAAAAVTVSYHNSDSKKHTFEAVCSGSWYHEEAIREDVPGFKPSWDH